MDDSSASPAPATADANGSAATLTNPQVAAAAAGQQQHGPAYNAHNGRATVPSVLVYEPTGALGVKKDDGLATASPTSPANLRSPSTRTRTTSHTDHSGRPRLSTQLSRSDLIERKHHARKIRNESRNSYTEILRVRASVIPRVLVPSLLHTVWAALWTTLYQVAGWRWISIPPQLITILGVVISLLLVFRTNTAYDRYWEGRRVWGTLITQIRNLARFVWIGVQTPDTALVYEKKGAMNLLLGFAVATKHYLRSELGHKYADLHHLLVHLPEFRSGAKDPNVKNLPLEISFHISSYIAACRQKELIDVSQQTAMVNALSSMIDCLTSFERIRNTPIPIAYSVHLQQTLTLYILALPFQLVSVLYWGTIPVCWIAAFTMLGIECIGGEIENPFGYDENDLQVEEFCRSTREELLRVMVRPQTLDPATWGAPFVEGEFKDLETMVRSAGGSVDLRRGAEEVGIVIEEVGGDVNRK
ncbi:Bestrophin, RFP-TM, chloride channel-domain-containing protein [Fimicolochytrium jonesii]|uniref:Bestrophin, RFP-TM, chloride channel-domain-containing protein n=1 Tax=Fimicolochytrium jonesii TaxID=1396493 RepID=UPI0022FEFD8A|nr:Bestrophin, RFP-TM, chloride channel-domain-containing protein [Fimicolochytrium jonesii]KAI8816333.1 Bestrophin, RFP-TM, chloride channel-domain-containing protein [Fimicolochytrium jonesii]